MNNLYDLVKVVNPPRSADEFQDAVGIIKEIHYDNYYEILFIGKHLNELSIKQGRVLFTDKEIQGI